MSIDTTNKTSSGYSVFIKSVKGSRTTNLKMYFRKHENTMSRVQSRTLEWMCSDSSYVKIYVHRKGIG